jgi:hypothetical protein
MDWPRYCAGKVGRRHLNNRRRKKVRRDRSTKSLKDVGWGDRRRNLIR